MTNPHLQTESNPASDTLLLLVVGAGIPAELVDRPIADRLRDRIRQWQTAQESCPHPLVPVVCTDLWYLNAPDLMARPTISIGEPRTNAATAYLANRLPTAFVIDDTLRIQLDQEFIDLHSCLWGVNPDTTAKAVDLFEERYLDEFLQAALDLCAS